MINKVFLTFTIILFAGFSFAQTASSYFPAETGHKWYFKTEVLDTLNNPVDSLTTFRIDSFAVNSTFKEKAAKVVLSKSGPQLTIVSQPYLDTNYINLEGSNGSVYFRIANSEQLRLLFDSLALDTLFGSFDTLINTLFSFEKWYSFYKFGNFVNFPYTIFTYDTTITIDTLTLPLRFGITGKRISDATLATDIGTFDCKRFINQYKISYRVEIPPLPTILIPLLTLNDSIYIAPGNWIVQTEIPSTVLDLSYLQLPSFSLPGLKVSSIPEIIPPVKVNDKIIDRTPQLSLNNYPNPFSSSTTIIFKIPKAPLLTKERGWGEVATLKLYDLLGREITTLINAPMESGTYEFSLKSGLVDEGVTLSNGIYFLRLNYGSSSVTQKLVVLD